MSDTAAKVEEFLSANPEIDDKAAADLRDAPEQVQEQVLRRGDMSDARNKSSALVARLRDARRHVSGDASHYPKEKVDQFIEENPELDEKAIEALRQAPGYAQKAAIEKG